MLVETASKLTRPSRLLRRVRHFGHEAAPILRPIFIVGTVRSGTTILAECLGRHPGVFHHGFEQSDQWARYPAAEIGVPTCGCRCPRQTEVHLTDEQCRAIRRRFSRFTARAGVHRGERWLTKNPHFCNKLRFLKAIFPDVTIIVTSRDIRNSIASIKNLWEYARRASRVRFYLPRDASSCWSCFPDDGRPPDDVDRTFPGGDVSVIGEYWIRMHEQIERDAQACAGIHFVRHRDLVDRPEAVLDHLADSAGLEPASFDLGDSIDRSRNDRWLGRLTPNEVRSMEAFIEANEDRIRSLGFADTTL